MIWFYFPPGFLWESCKSHSSKPGCQYDKGENEDSKRNEDLENMNKDEVE